MSDKPVTFSLNANDPLREVVWAHVVPQRIDMLYYTQKMVSQKVYDLIESIPEGDLYAIQKELSKFI